MRIFRFDDTGRLEEHLGSQNEREKGERERERELEPELNIGWGGDRRGSRSVIPVFLGLALRLKDEENKPERKAERGQRWRRICETSLRKYAQLNFSTPSAFPRLPIPFSSRPLPFTLSPSDSRPGLSLSSPSLLLFLFFPLDLCLVPSVTLPCSLLLSSLLSLTLSLSLVSLLLASLPFYLALSLSLSFCLLCRLRLVGPSLFCHATLVRAVPLYLPPPVVPSSLKAVQSNRWHTKGRFCRCS